MEGMCSGQILILASPGIAQKSRSDPRPHLRDAKIKISTPYTPYNRLSASNPPAPMETQRAERGRVCFRRFQNTASPTMSAISDHVHHHFERLHRRTEHLRQPAVPDRPINDAQVHEVDQQGFLRDGPEHVGSRVTRRLACAIAPSTTSDAPIRIATSMEWHPSLVREQRFRHRIDGKPQRNERRTGHEQRRVRIATEIGGTERDVECPSAAPVRMYAAHGNSGNCDPIDGDRNAATQGDSADRFALHSIGVDATMSRASASRIRVKSWRDGAASSSSCTVMKVTPINCSTSMARNERQRSSVAVVRYAKRSTGKCSA